MTVDSDDFSDCPFRALGASQSDSQCELEQKFRAAARRLHPDRTSQDNSNREKFLEITRAWKLIDTENKRRLFNLQQKQNTLDSDVINSASINVSEMEFDEQKSVYVHDCRCGEDICVLKEDLELIKE